MNNMLGLNVHDPTKDLSEKDAKILRQFRDAFEAKKPADAGNVPLTNKITSTDSLPKCGWRPLDDETLYRYLCADRRDGEFHPDLSMKRLLMALQDRRDYRTDEMEQLVRSPGPPPKKPRIAREPPSLEPGADGKLNICSLPPDALAEVVACLCHQPYYGGQTHYEKYVENVYPALRSIPGLYSTLRKSSRFQFLQADAKQDYGFSRFYDHMEFQGGQC